MDEIEGPTVYDSMDHAHGMIANELDATLGAPPLPFQSHGSSFTFGGEAYVDLGTGPFDYIHQTADFSIIGFVSPAQLSTQLPVVASSQATVHKGFRIDILNGSLRAILTTGSANRVLSATTALSADTPHMFAFVGNGTTLSLYVDGVLEDSTTAITGSGGATFPTRIGRFPTSLIYLEGGVDELMFLNRAATADELALYYLAATNEVAGHGVTPACDPSEDLWGCDCPNMQGFGSCNITSMTAAIDFASPSTIDRTGWMDTYYDSSAEHWVVEVDADEMPSEGLTLAPPNEGYWDNVGHLVGYLSDLLDVPIDPATGLLEPFVFHQSGRIVAYYAGSNKLATSSMLYYQMMSTPAGVIWVDGELYQTSPREECRGILTNKCFRTVNGVKGECTNEVDALSPDGSFAVTASVALHLFEDGPTRTSACGDYRVHNLRVNGSQYVFSPPVEPDLEDIAGTNPLHCTTVNGAPAQCTLIPLDELVPPVGMAPSDPGYFDNLDVRIMTPVRGDIDLTTRTFNNQEPKITEDYYFTDAYSVQINNTYTRQVINATCLEAQVVRDASWLEIEIGVADDRSTDRVDCAE